jgi:transcriptional regulator with XRE-family HTH domain
MSELARIIDGYKDRHGQPSDASIARAIGVAPQTLDSWLNRGMKSVPRNKEPLRRLAQLVGLDYRVIVDAVAVDIGLVDEMPPYGWPGDAAEEGAG